MKGYTIQHSIELLEKKAGSGSGASTASQVSFDNTGTGLDATNVQEALVELETNVSAIISVAALYPTDSVEHRIGDNLFIKHYSGASLSQEYTILEAEFPHTILHSYGQVTSSKVGETGYRYPINQFQSATAGYEAAVLGVPGADDSYSLQLYADDALRGAYDVYVVYSKATSEAKKTKKKQEEN